jgi:hypothetical protein
VDIHINLIITKIVHKGAPLKNRYILMPFLLIIKFVPAKQRE